ncbi:MULTISPECIES: hypothetical protein [unclassified Streptomyces]|uniref:hypothetical protein n=1 Tax=unclassified Streptomyces TaxID=2593676 RepID=UPI0038200F29
MAEDRNAELAALARQAVAAAGGLRLLVERMGDLGWRMQDYRDEDLLNVASALRGTAILIALDTEDMDLHEEVTGRRAPGARCRRVAPRARRRRRPAVTLPTRAGCPGRRG